MKAVSFILIPRGVSQTATCDGKYFQVTLITLPQSLLQELYQFRANWTGPEVTPATTKRIAINKLYGRLKLIVFCIWIYTPFDMKMYIQSQDLY